MGRNSFNQFITGISFGALLLGSFALDTGSAIAIETDAGVEVEAGDSVVSETPKTAAETGNTNRITRKGLTIEFTMKPVLGSFEEERDLLDHDFANAVFHITDAATGQPVRGLIPGAWMDIRKTARGETTEALTCKDRVGLYLRGSTGARPMVDLNSYFILVLNEDSTITVVDPSVLIAGVGDMFFTQVILNRPGADWVQTRDQKRLFVSMPRANAVAVVDTETFKLTGHIQTGKEPFRVALQGDEKYLWVGNNAKGKDGGGVTVVDVETLKVAATIETGKGHHEIAFSDDDRYALVTNRNDGTASLIDIQSLEKIEDIEIGAMPISVSYSKLSKAFYVADGKTGIVAVVDAATRQVTARIAAKTGLGPMGITADGRWVLVTNSVADLVHVIDTATNEIAHDVAISGRPFKISLTRAFAYVRALDSEMVSMINLAMLGDTGNPPVVAFPAGAKPPSAASSLGIADSIVEAAGEAGVVLVSPAENTLYYYMEGMNAPIGNFQSYGHNPRAVMVTDRSLDEREPGAYSAKIQLPVAGTYDVAFILDSPRILHCFSVEAKENPLLKKDLKPLEVEYLVEEKRVAAGQTVPLRFRLIDPATEQPRSGLEDVRVLSYRSPGRNRTETSAKEVGDGIYEADVAFPRHGAYFVFVSSRSSKMPYGELPYLTMRAFRDEASLERALSAKGTGG